ncbi:MAG: ABC transporter permease [Clostridiales bacterium]|jgi:ribose transport system permease protein|nr:ABC transporter permease [Clostridiales bacterium]
MKNRWETIKNYFPLLGLLILVVFFSIATGGALLSPISLQSLLNQVIATALVALGSVFVFGSGNFDMSLGACLSLSAVLGGMADIATGSLIVAFLVCIGLSLLLGLLKGLFASFVDVPLFIVTIVLGSLLSAFTLFILGDASAVHLKDALQPLPSFSFSQMSVINLVVLLSYFSLCLVLFLFMPIGRQVKILGGNAVTARQSGIPIKKVKVGAFLIGALGIGLAAFVILVRVRNIGASTASSMGTDVMIALVLGGMPLSGGPRSRISAGLVGATSITVLNAGLTMMGLNIAVIQIFRAVVFLVVVYVASMTYRTRLLPR